MNEKKSINISFGTAICICIIILLLAVIVGMYFYYNKDNNTVNSNITTNNSNSFKLGKYIINPDKEILGEEFVSENDEYIEFQENGKFIIYQGWGNSLSGTYTVSNNEIKCLIDTAFGEYSPEQKTSATISFRVNNNSEVEVTNASSTYKIQISDTVNKTLLDETKDMSLSPFVVGIKFSLSN